MAATDFEDIKTKLEILESRMSEMEYFLNVYLPFSIEKLLEVRGLKVVRTAEKSTFTTKIICLSYSKATTSGAFFTIY